MNEIINLDERRLSKMSNDELLVEAIEKASKHIFEQGNVIKSLSKKIDELEERMVEKDDEISFIHRILEST